MFSFGASQTAWYFTPDGELRECIATLYDGQVVGVIDDETLDEVAIDPKHVLLERPE